jgi:hypothetical protein
VVDVKGLFEVTKLVKMKVASKTELLTLGVGRHSSNRTPELDLKVA